MWLLYSILALLCWSNSQLFLKRGYRNIPALWTVIIDLPIYILLFVPISLARGARLIFTPVDAILIILISLCMQTFYYGLTQGKLAITATIIAIYPVITVILSLIFLQERLSSVQLVMILLILAGGTILSLSERGDKVDNTPFDKKIIIWPVVTAVCIGIGDFLAKVTIGRMGVDNYNLSFPILNIIAVSFFWLIDKKDRKPPKGKNIGLWGFTILGVTIEILGFLFFNYALATGPVSLVTPITSSYAALTVILAFIFLREKIKPIQIFGILLASLGIIFLGMG